MEKKIRELLFEPLRKGTLGAIVPHLVFHSGEKEISTPAQLIRNDDEFEFTLHFDTGRPPPEMQALHGGFLSTRMTTRSRGTSITVLHSHRMHLTAESTDQMTAEEVDHLIGRDPAPRTREENTFYAHLIFHGPKLPMRDAGTTVTTRNDFLGEAVRSSENTHRFSSSAWEGALIQQDRELHLHLRSREGSPRLSDKEVIDLVDHASQAVGFVVGFHPWPAYREIRVNHRICERWLSPRFDLSAIYLAPISETMWAHFREDRSNPFHQIIATITSGLADLSAESHKKLTMLLWHFRSGNSRNVPSSTRLLILCAVLDGLMKLVAKAENQSRAATDKTWRKASDTLGFSWDRWTKNVFEVWGKHRHLLAHGWLWLGEELDAEEFFTDHARLGCAFLTLVAAYCGYEGPIIADPFKNRINTIADLKAGTSVQSRELTPGVFA